MMTQPGLFDNEMPVGLTLREYTQLIGNAISRDPSLRMAWVKAELSDLRSSRGHVYMELVEKSETGTTVAKLRANIWASQVPQIMAKFQNATNAQLRSGLKVMVCGSVQYHEVYGMSFNIVDIDPSYTLGDLERLRREILMRLQKEGILEFNKARPFPKAPQKIAVISSETAAGYGDFMRQLMDNTQGFRFYTKLYPAMMQGGRTSESVRQALAKIEETVDFWDCVVIVRGGGATTDLNDFDDYDLARAVAIYPIPVIVGIGHERDRTVLDEIACVRMKTPTAVAGYLVGALQEAAEATATLVSSIKNQVIERLREEERMLQSMAGRLQSLVTGHISQGNMALTKYRALIPGCITTVLEGERAKLTGAIGVLKVVSGRNVAEGSRRLDQARTDLERSAFMRITMQKEKLRALFGIVNAFSPENTLRRGYSITRAEGHCVTSAHGLAEGITLETTLADGKILSIVTKQK